MPDLRIRVDLSDFVNGLNGMRWMYLSGDKVSMVADLVNVIREEYEEVKADDCVNLFLDGFSLPSWEPIKILKDGDLVKGFLSKGKPSKRQLSECDNERCSPKKRKKLEAKNQEISGVEQNKLKSPKMVAVKNASPESKLQNVKEVAKKKTESSSPSSSSSSEDEAVKKPSQEVIKNNAKKDSPTSSSSSSEDEKKPTANQKKETVTTKRPPAVSVKATNSISSSSDDSSSSSSSEDEQPTKQATTKKIPPVKSTPSQKKDSSSSSDSSSDSESDEPTKTQISNKTNTAPTKPKRKRKRKNKNKNKLPPSDTASAENLPKLAPSPAAWHKSKNSHPPQNNRIVFEDSPSETFTPEQIQELYKMSKPAKSMPSPRPDLLPKVNNFPRNAPGKTPIGPSLPSCEAAILSGQDEKANTNETKQSSRIVFHPRVVTFTNGDKTGGSVDASERDNSGGAGGFSSLLNSNGAMFVRSKKSAKRQQSNDVQTNVSVVITNPVNGQADHENDSSTVVDEERKDYSVYHPVSEGGPRKGDIIAYKVVEISQNYTPELSEYKEGKVLEWDGTGKVTLELINKQIKKREGRFEVEGMTDDVGGEVVKEFFWSDIIEPRLIFP